MISTAFLFSQNFGFQRLFFKCKRLSIIKPVDFSVDKVIHACSKVTQNVNLFCAGVGLSTVPRASMDQEALRKLLKLSDTQVPMMNNPVGYSK